MNSNLLQRSNFGECLELSSEFHAFRITAPMLQCPVSASGDTVRSMCTSVTFPRADQPPKHPDRTCECVCRSTTNTQLKYLRSIFVRPRECNSHSHFRLSNPF